MPVVVGNIKSLFPTGAHGLVAVMKKSIFPGRKRGFSRQVADGVESLGFLKSIGWNCWVGLPNWEGGSTKVEIIGKNANAEGTG